MLGLLSTLAIGNPVGLLIVVVLVLLLVGAWPRWEHSREYGPWPSGVIGTVLVIFLILWLLGRL